MIASHISNNLMSNGRCVIFFVFCLSNACFLLHHGSTPAPRGRRFPACLLQHAIPLQRPPSRCDAERAEELDGGARAGDLHDDGDGVVLVENVVRQPRAALPRVHRP